MTEIKEDCKAIDSFDDQLDCLRRNLLKAQEALNTTESDISASEKQITAIEALISKRDQIIADYVKAYPGLKAKYDEFKAIYNNEINSLKNILGDEGEVGVKEIVNQTRGRVEIHKNNIKIYSRRLNGVVSRIVKRNALDSRRQELEYAKKVYDYWIDPVKSIESRFKSLERIKKEVDKEQSAENYEYAYYLLELVKEDSFKYYLDEFLSIPAIPAIPAIPEDPQDPGAPAVPAVPAVPAIPAVIDPKEINKKLIEVWRNYQKADEAFQRTAGEVKALEKGIETSKKQLAEDEKNLEATLKRLLNSEIEDGGSGNGGSSCGGSSSGSTPDSSGKKQYGNTSTDPVPKMPGPHQSGVSSQ